MANAHASYFATSSLMMAFIVRLNVGSAGKPGQEAGSSGMRETDGTAPTLSSEGEDERAKDAGSSGRGAGSIARIQFVQESAVASSGSCLVVATRSVRLLRMRLWAVFGNRRSEEPTTSDQSARRASPLHGRTLRRRPCITRARRRRRCLQAQSRCERTRRAPRCYARPSKERNSRSPVSHPSSTSVTQEEGTERPVPQRLLG